MTLGSPNNLNALGLAVADHISAMLAYWDSNLVCRFANAAYLDWFGKTRDEMIDKITLNELLGPLFEKNYPFIQGALNGERQTFEREIKTPSGDVRYAIANYFPDVENGKVRGFFVHVADITQNKILEKELLASNKIINDQNKRLLNFANTVSHNLRSHATNISGMLKLYDTATSQSEKDEIISFLKKASDRCNQTLDNLSEIVKAQNGLSIKSEDINLFGYIDKTISVLRLQIQTSQADILNRVSTDINIHANAAYIESIILNLLTNALKYRHPQRKLVVEVSAEQNNGRVRLKIKDNGLGINLKKHGNDIFGMFKTFHGNKDAHGIGLYITKFQTEAMNGKIEVTSEENQGTTFTIDFPA
jgi:PAS domain S-box-containing protein